jgi:hypothetical protein
VGTVTRKDLAEMRRRLGEIMFSAECGYDPVYDEDLREWLWVKCHWGFLHTHAGALEEIARDESRPHDGL